MSVSLALESLMLFQDFLSLLEFYLTITSANGFRDYCPNDGCFSTKPVAIYSLHLQLLFPELCPLLCPLSQENACYIKLSIGHVSKNVMCHLTHSANYIFYPFFSFLYNRFSQLSFVEILGSMIIFLVDTSVVHRNVCSSISYPSTFEEPMATPTNIWQPKISSDIVKYPLREPSFPCWKQLH